MHTLAFPAVLCSLALASSPEPSPLRRGDGPAPALPICTEWTTYGVAEGLPSEKVLCVLVDGEDVWAGTERGLARLCEGEWRTFTTADGLAHDVVSSLAVSEETGDLWIGTLGGLSRLSGGRIDSFTQVSSGLINDVVYAVAAVGSDIWAATASGVSVYHPARRSWDLYNHENTVMHEPWCYGLAHSSDRVWIAVWGGGVVEHDLARSTWKAYRDPDGEMEIDLVRDDGLVHDVVSSVSWSETDGALWVASYFGLSRYDGSSWRSWLQHESPLPSNFVNVVCARDGWAWIGTDTGLAACDGRRWVVYGRDRDSAAGTILIDRDDGQPERRITASGLENTYVFGVAPGKDGVWVATARGLSVGTLPPVDPGR